MSKRKFRKQKLITYIQVFLGRTKHFGIIKMCNAVKELLNFLANILTDTGLINPQFQQTILKRRISRILIEKFYGYWGHDINTSQFFLGLGLIHYSLIRNLKPINILCIGSKQGFIPAILALACKDNGLGHIDFVDAAFDDSEPVRHWGGIGYWKSENAFDNFRKLGIFDYITPFIMTTKEFARKSPHKKYQYIYIDGDHSYSGVKKDYEYFWPMLTKGGIMALHDVSEKGYLSKGRYGVWKFWNHIGKKRGITLSMGSGLGILQKV